MNIKIYPVGSKVKLEADIPAKIIAVLLSPNNDIQYKICWWNGRDRKTEWMYPLEFTPESYSDVREIGFK